MTRGTATTFLVLAAVTVFIATANATATDSQCIPEGDCSPWKFWNLKKYCCTKEGEERSFCVAEHEDGKLVPNFYCGMCWKAPCLIPQPSKDGALLRSGGSVADNGCCDGYHCENNSPNPEGGWCIPDKKETETLI